jgi:hypothetical protein
MQQVATSSLILIDPDADSRTADSPGPIALGTIAGGVNGSINGPTRSSDRAA